MRHPDNPNLHLDPDDPETAVCATAGCNTVGMAAVMVTAWPDGRCGLCHLPPDARAALGLRPLVWEDPFAEE